MTNRTERLYDISGSIRLWIDVLGLDYTNLSDGNV